MSMPAAQNWTQLVESYDRAQQLTNAAFTDYDRLKPADSADTPEEMRYEAARDAELEIEDQLLAAQAPDLEAIALQIKIFGLRFCSADFDHEPMPGEDQPQGLILRRIHDALLSAAEQLSPHRDAH